MSTPDDWNEDRINIIGQNGNDGLHYEATCVFDNYTKIYKGIMAMENKEKEEVSEWDKSYEAKVKNMITETSTRLVIKDMLQRETFGYNKYGKFLTVDTDENMLQHLYEELLDGAVYIRTLIEQRKRNESN